MFILFLRPFFYFNRLFTLILWVVWLFWNNRNEAAIKNRKTSI